MEQWQVGRRADDDEDDEEDNDDSPDKAKELAELGMQAVFDWNQRNEVVDASLPRIDLATVVEETYEETMELQRLLAEQESGGDDEEDVSINEEVAEAAAEFGEGAERLGGGVDDEIPPYKPTEVTNLFEESYNYADEDEEESFSDPDMLTAALGRHEEFLYGFEASFLPRGVLDAVEAAGKETRLMAYSRLLAGLASQPYHDNLRLARQLKWVSRVIVPTEKSSPLMVTDEELTKANVVGIKKLVNITDSYAKASRTSSGSWCLWIMKFLRNRDEDAEGHLPLDDETLGVLWDLRSQSEKDTARMKVGGRMYRKALEEEVFKTGGGLLTDVTPEQFSTYAATIGQRMLYIAGEMRPADDRAYDITRETVREVMDEMASLAYDKAVIELGREVSEVTRRVAEACPMSAAEVLRAITQIAFFTAEPLTYFQKGEAGVSTRGLEKAMEQMILLNSEFLQNRRLYEIYAKDCVEIELENPAPAGANKIGARLLRRVMDIYVDDVIESNLLVLGQELSQVLFDGNDGYPNLRQTWENLMWNLELLENADDENQALERARDAVLSALVEKLIEAGMQEPSEKTSELCSELGMGEAAMKRAFSRVSGDIFEKSLLSVVRNQREVVDGPPSVLFRSDPLTDQELQDLKDTAENVGVSSAMALEVVAKEMRVSLKNMVTRAGKSMRNNMAKEGAKIIGETTDLLNGLCKQLITAFGGADLTSTVSIAGQLPSLDEYWASELCFKMVDAVRDPVAAQEEAGIPGALTADPEPTWEEDANTVLELLGLRGGR